ncbi:MAG: TetR/AcrR family transcriptional regulator [Sarcina sp.]
MDSKIEKKAEITNAAVYLFSNNGFSSTSVQDIASYCNISKATIYKLFKSKEDILVEIIKDLNKQNLLLIESIDATPNMTNLEKFEAKIYSFFDHLSNKKDFTLMVYQDSDISKNEEVKKTLSESRLLILNWFKNLIIETYGDESKIIVWDMVFILSGIIKEFSNLFILKNSIAKDMREVSKYVVRNITMLVNANLTQNPLIQYESISCVSLNRDTLINKDLLKAEADRLVKRIKDNIKTAQSIVNKEEVIEALEHIVTEKQKEAPKKYVVDSLLLYLSKYKELEKDVLFLDKIYQRI